MASKINSLFIVFAFMSITAMANVSLAVTAAPVANVYNVNYKAVETGKVKVFIYNYKNELVFSEVLNGVASFSRPYNFSEMEEGSYTIVLESKNGKQTQTVYHSFSKATTFITVKELTDAANKYQLSLASSTGDVVSVKIYNASSALLHEERLNVLGRTGVVFDLTKVKSESITFEISTASGKVERVTF